MKMKNPLHKSDNSEKLQGLIDRLAGFLIFTLAKQSGQTLTWNCPILNLILVDWNVSGYKDNKISSPSVKQSRLLFKVLYYDYFAVSDNLPRAE